MKIFCINIYDSQAHRALKLIYEHVIHICKNFTLQDHSRVLVILTILSTFQVRLPFSTIQACFQKEVIVIVDSMTINSMYGAIH